MSKTKKIIGYILGFILTILLASLITLNILRITIFSPNYIKKTFAENNYYQKITDKVKENMKDYMVSSGLTEEILTNIYTIEDVKKDVNKFIDNLYIGKKIEVDDTALKEKLYTNIDDYLTSKNLKIIDQESLDSFVSEMTKIYKNEIKLYNMVDNYASLFSKIRNILNTSVIILLIISVILLVTILLIKFHCLGSISIAGGLILLFIRFVIYEKVDFNNLLIISKEFSLILRELLNAIAVSLANYAYILLAIGVVLALGEAFLGNKKKKSKSKK